MKYIVTRILGTLFLGIFFILGWRIVNGQETVCRAVGQEIHCWEVPQVPDRMTPLDPSVIRAVPDGVQLSPETLHILKVRACVQKLRRQGWKDEDIRRACIR